MIEGQPEGDIALKLTYGDFDDPDGDLRYAHEKLGAAVWKLAVGRGKLKERLADAFIELAIIQEGDLPPESWEELRETRHELTGGKMNHETRLVEGRLVERPIGLLSSTLRYMRFKRARDIAERICNLEAKVGLWIEAKE